MTKRKNDEIDEMEEDIKKYKDDDDLTVINDQICIGNERGSQNFGLLKLYGITAILNCSSESPVYFKDKILYLKIDLDDNFETDLSKVYKIAFDFIDKNERVFIFCQKGVSRSPSILISYLMKKTQKDLKYCYEFLKEKRQGVLPNVSFMWQLIKYEKEIFGSESLSFTDYLTTYFFPLFEDFMTENDLKSKIEEIVKTCNNFDDLINKVYEI